MAGISNNPSPQPTPIPAGQNAIPQPDLPDNQKQVGISASQMGWNQSESSDSKLNIKKLIVKCILGLVALGGIFVALIFTNIIALSQFKTISYVNSGGTRYSLLFYTKYATKTLKSGNTQLVSRVSEEGKYPLVLSIVSGSISGLDKNGIKTCSGPLPKVFDVQNNNLGKQISVCSAPPLNGTPIGVYVAGFAADNKANIITISQDLSGEDLSSQSAAQESLSKFGLDAYQDDIKQIIASIKVE